MAKITISGMDENKKPTTGTTGGTTAGNTNPSGGSGTAAGTTSGTGTGSSSSNSGTSGGRFDFSSIISGIFGNKNNAENSGQEQINKNEQINENQQKAETSLAQLKSDYSKKLRDNYEYSAEKFRKERDDALRENWVLQQKAEAALPEQIAAAGINGGASESTLANLRAQYQGNRNDIRKGYMNNLGELAQQHSADEAEAQRGYNERWLDYLLSLAEIEERSKYDVS